MLYTLTNINCEIKSMAVYSTFIAMAIHTIEDTNGILFSAYIWEIENQLNAAMIQSIPGATGMTSEQ